MTTSADFLARLDAVGERLRQSAAESPGGATAPDGVTGETWEVTQVWAHMAEFIPYWIEQADHVVSRWCGEPIPFGRTKKDPIRVAAIAAGRGQSVEASWAAVEVGITQLHVWITRLEATSWNVVGQHETMGSMPLPRIVDEFLVGHLDEHLAQLDELRAHG